MHSRRGSIGVTALVIAVDVIVAVLAFNSMNKNYFPSDNYSQKSEASKDVELTKTDEISDIEMDLNSTNIDSLDVDVLGITSEVE